MKHKKSNFQFASFEQYRTIRAALDARVDELHDRLYELSVSTEIGMRIAKKGKEEDYQTAKNQYKVAFAKLGEINRIGVKQYKKEVYDFNMAQRLSKTT